ncbi:MAG: long-chain fatty acid--CoA ligase [Sphingobacteriia bacterium]|nr:long-chain fatty acid--CoA ligase [Sphingobacteriia bacterium]NCC38557.1 long-chain fatty acid--CoA ligase [Gammaproteobacteria bacterium]
MSQWTNDMIPIDQAATLDGLFMERVRRTPDGVAYRHCDRGGTWHDLTWAQMSQQVARWRAALAGEGLVSGDRVAILLRNCPEWVMFDQAALALGLVLVPLYTDDRPDNASYILQDAGVQLLLVQDAGRWSRLAEAIATAPCPRRVVILDSSEAASRHAEMDRRVVVARDWLPGEAPALESGSEDPQALATIVYTSGTTGRPKGVMLTHRNILGNAHGVLSLIDCYREDLFLSFLPLSHTLERTGGYYLPMMAGACVAFARSIAQLAEDLQVIRPTVIIAVPRVFERVHQRILDQLRTRPAPVRWLFRLAVTTGWHAFLREQGRGAWHPLLLLWPFLRRKVSTPVLARLGGRMRIAASGGAPLSSEVARTFISLRLPLLQGYGLTETSPVISFNPLQDNIPESVGIPLPGIELRIGPEDELLVKGECVMSGYWNNPEATARILTPDGWLHTGDQVRILDGHLYITGRIKDILVLSNGEKVPPGDLEMAIASDPLFEQVVVIGEGRSHLTALVVLSAEPWSELARAHGLAPEHPESLEDHEIHNLVIKRIRACLADFPGYAKIRRVTLMLEPWSIDNGLLTPTMKIKRSAVMSHYQEAIDEMYDPQV